jgi:hypothetical protein
MQKRGQITQEVDGQGYCIAVRRIWEKNGAMTGGMTQVENA